MRAPRLLLIALILLVLNAGWIWAFPEASAFYVANVLLHIGLGGVMLAAMWFSRREAVRSLRRSRLTFPVLSLAGVLGVILAVIGAIRPHLWLVILHGAAGFVGAALLVLWLRRTSIEGARWTAGALAVALALPAYSWLRDHYFPREYDRIVNPQTAPVSMDYEGGGAGSPFFPSSSDTNTGDLIPSDFFMDSAACGKCHEDIYEQWESSMHHFSSFNNQFYRKSIEYMQEVAGVQPSKWCAGCHDHAMFFNGRFERPVKEQMDTPQAHTGLGCMSCHSIVHVPDSMGNGGFVIEYPPMHDLLASDNWAVRALHDYVTYTAPAAHRRAFMKPFMRKDSAEFCSTCHKVHLDVPVNDYRWFRGFNEYDAWQASGVSGQGARSFYYPDKPAACADCHMPLVKSNDPGNRKGFVHSHRFPAANTAVAYVNNDEEQLLAEEEFLQAGIVTVDIFAAAPARERPHAPEMRRRADQGPLVATTFAIGEEAAGGRGPVVLREVDELSAPIDRVGTSVQPGDTVRVDVVVRTRKVGHFFPGGTVDSVDCWVELRAFDALGRDIFWSGRVLDEGRGPVEPGAHFYRSALVDEHSNPINKRNAFQARGLLYARLIPPGAADVSHFRIAIPEETQGPVTLQAKVNYRKFSYYYTQFSYAGKAVEGSGESGRSFDDREYTFKAEDIPANVSGEIKDRIPNLPITVLAEAEAKLRLGGTEPEWRPVATPDDYPRWNDYGIGLLLQGDLRGAQHAFERVIDAKPDYADGWLNVARTLIEEGRTEEARPYVEKALELAPDHARNHYFAGLIEKTAGAYDAALAHLREAARQYPRDRVVLNEIGRILFLQRKYEAALETLDRVALIDPEDLQMHYTRMLAYRGLGEAELAERSEKLFRRFKADEASQTRTAAIRMRSPEDNNERQAIHEHLSAPLPPLKREVPSDDD